MGQYHILVNLDKQELVDPHGLGLGAKQYEHTGCDGSLSDAMYLLCMTSPASGGGDWPMIEGLSGRWVGDRVVIMGDYTQDDAIKGFPNAKDLYSVALKTYHNLTKEVTDAFKEVWGLDYVEEELGSIKLVRRVLN